MRPGDRVRVLCLVRETGATVLAPARVLGPAPRAGWVRVCLDGSPAGPLFHPREVVRYHVTKVDAKSEQPAAPRTRGGPWDAPIGGASDEKGDGMRSTSSIVAEAGFGVGEYTRRLERGNLWGVFDAYNVEGTPEIQRIDEPEFVDEDGEVLTEPLESDDAALGLVVRLALDGAGLAHEQAVAALRESGIEVRRSGQEGGRINPERKYGQLTIDTAGNPVCINPRRSSSASGCIKVSGTYLPPNGPKCPPGSGNLNPQASQSSRAP